MFKIVQEPTFTHEVIAKVPVDGGFRDEKFKATFRVIDPEEAESFDLSKVEGSTNFLRRVIVRLSDIADAEGAPIEWNDEVFTAVVKLPWARGALARGYFGALTGAKSGN